MSQGEKRWLAEVQPLADGLARLLEPSCVRIAIAGSIRRLVPAVSDIELVAVPAWETRETPGLFGPATSTTVNLLEERVQQLMFDGLLALRDVELHRRGGEIEIGHRNGAAYKALEYAGFPVDLFITDVERWGCIFALRTGPYDWNIRLVQDCQRIFRKVDAGRVLHLGKPVPTLEERDFFAAIGQAWIEPPERHVDRVRVDAAIANAALPAAFEARA